MNAKEKKEKSEATTLVGLMFDRAKKVERDGDEYSSVKMIYNKLDDDSQSDVDLIFEALCGFTLGKLIRVMENK